MIRKIILILFAANIFLACGGETNWETANVRILVNDFPNAPIAQTVIISVGASESVYEDQDPQSTIELGEIEIGTNVQASVTSIDGPATVDILVENYIGGSDSCEQVGCTATANYTVEQEACVN